MKSAFKATKTITLMLGFLAIVLISLVAFSSRFNLPGGFRAYSVLTGSMEPVIQTGSLILTQVPRSTDEIKKRSVITFEEPGYENKFITHRVSQVVESNPGVVFKTRGDANSNDDPWLISYGRIKGVYLMHFPYLGALLEFIKSPTGIVIFIVIPVLLIISNELKNIVSALAEIKVEKEKKRKEGDKTNSLVLIWLLLIPVVCLGIGNTRALFVSNSVVLAQNSISVAEASQSPSPTPSESPSSSPSSSPSPSTSPSPSGSPSPTGSPSPSPSPSGIVIDGNGSGSENQVDIDNETNCEVNQETSTDVNIDIDNESDTGGNKSSGNTGGNSNTNSGDAESNVTVNVSGGSDSSTGCP